MSETSGGSNNSSNSNNRKKALIVSVLAFLLTGGAVFLFFVIQGSRDLTGANKKANFTYGEAAREGAASFFKFIGFDDVESIASSGSKERAREKEYEAAGLLDTLASESPPAQEEAIPWGAPSASAKSSSPSNIPKMGGGTAGLGAIGGGGTRSSGGAARFADGTGAGNTKITAAAQGEGDGVQGKGSLASLAKTRALLGDGLRSGSAATAKGKWDSSFGVGRSGGGGGSDLAYGKSGLVGLDKIKKGEVDNLKTTDVKSLKTPEVGAPVKDKEAEAKDPAAKKAKEAAEDAISKSMASSVLGAMGQGLGSGSGRSGAQDRSGGLTGGESPLESGTCAPGSANPVCSSALPSQMKTDTNVTFNAIGDSPQGRVYEVAFKGTGPGITDSMKGQPSNYTDTAIVVVKPDGTTSITWGAITETPAAPAGQ